MKLFQKGFNYSQDGQGNRLVYHLQGCNMRCPWCSNPEGMKTEGTLIVDSEWLVPSICPYGAIQDKRVDRNRCEACKSLDCVTKYRTKGIRLSYEQMDISEMIDEVHANKMMFYDGGGVTFTGGEATLQYEELKSVLKELHNNGVHTALETNGTHLKLYELFPYVDQMIMDCKLCNSKRHMEYTGIKNNIILENLKMAAAEHSHLHIRVPLIGGVNNSKEERETMLCLFECLKGSHVTFEILSYHEYGRTKWEQCGFCYQMTEQAYVTAEEVKGWKAEMQKRGLVYQAT